ncbi:PBS lyase [Geomonas sp. Red276]
MPMDLDTISSELRSPDEEVRRLAVVELSRRPFESAMEFLFIAMGDESWRVRKEAVAVLAAANPTGDEVVERLIDLLRSSDNAGLRNSAVESLERLGQVAITPLCRYLEDPDHDLRKFVIDVLGSIGCASCVSLLVRSLEDTDPNVRVAAAENLGKIGDQSALPYLLQVLEREEVWLKFTVLDALAQIGAPVPLSALEPLLEERLLKRAVYDCLAVLGDGDCLPILFKGLGENARSARQSAGVALIRVRDRLSEDDAQTEVDLPLRLLRGSKTAEAMIAALNGADPAQLEPLVRLTGGIGDERATVPLLKLAGEERLRTSCLDALRQIGSIAIPRLLEHFSAADYQEKTIVAFLLGELGCSEATPLLVGGLADDFPGLRASCALALGRLASRGVSRAVARLLEDSEPQVRDAALQALQFLTLSDGETVEEICAEFVQSPSPDQRRQAALLLWGLADADRLSLLAKDEDPAVRRAAVSSLARVRLPQTVGHLSMALSDEDPEVRVSAAQALSEIGSPDVLEPLLVALSDPDPWVQTAALKGLSALGDRGALPGVRALLLKAHGPVLITGLTTLATVGGADELPAIEVALSDSDEEVVEAAIGIMSAFGDAWIDTHLDKLISHAHWGVRRSFVKTLAQLRGAQSLPLLERALEGESDSLVRGEIVGLIGRLSHAIQ